MNFAESFNIGEPTVAGGLKVFPLYPLHPAAVEVALLADAVAHNDATIAEDAHAEGPWFRRVVIENRGEIALLVRDGDLLLGGMQDRTAERSCVVPAHARVTVPALCVEQRRSHYAGREDFTVSRTSADPELRSTRVSASMRGESLQDLTWDGVATRRSARGIADGGGSLREVEEREAARLQEIEAKLPPVHLACGVAIAWTGRKGIEVHVEVFGNAQACTAAWPGLVRAAAQCTGAKARPPRVSRTELRKLFREASAATFEDAPPVGTGHLQRAEFGTGVATILSLEGRLVHASLFAA
jgi:hypothetical protein